MVMLTSRLAYFAPNVGTQSETLLSKLDYGKVFAIHEADKHN